MYSIKEIEKDEIYVQESYECKSIRQYCSFSKENKLNFAYKTVRKRVSHQGFGSYDEKKKYVEEHIPVAV